MRMYNINNIKKLNKYQLSFETHWYGHFSNPLLVSAILWKIFNHDITNSINFKYFNLYILQNNELIVEHYNHTKLTHTLYFLLDLFYIDSKEDVLYVFDSISEKNRFFRKLKLKEIYENI